MPLPLMTLMTGKENRRVSLVEVNAYYCPTNRQDREVPLFAMAKNASQAAVRKVGNPQVYGSITGILPDICGLWFEQGYQFAENSIIKLWVRRKTSFTAMQEIGAVCLRVRGDAALMRATIPLLAQPDSVRAEAVVEGRFDVLSGAEAGQCGVFIEPQFAYQMVGSQVRKVIRFATVAPAIRPWAPPTAPVIMDTPSGPRPFTPSESGRDLDLFGG